MTCSPHGKRRTTATARVLARFARHRDGDAFAQLLVRRHGPLVLGTPRRLLGHVQDAEDVFQATFLVLAAKARGLRRSAALGAWLHRVAVRAAWEARRQAAARRRREEAVARPEQVTAADHVMNQEVQAILDAELTALPHRYHAPLVLCHLEGLTLTEAAARLGWPKGTITGPPVTGTPTCCGSTSSAAALPPPSPP